ncbi:unnamed protein product [Rotaria sordida]|uniref:F-box domain-containing protein n=2 Tax=Rotaria sordida TaxID=392033 RepID=A0A819FZB6_9BILA|nr:unnamed protein product [Rotaria sordida]CAF3876176.1 unnamed protein product [Rotaria sordida]
MKFELLPNEILLDLFDYFNGVDLLRGFYDLNTRFNFLLYNQFRNYRFKFDSVSKHNFDMICQQHLSFIANRVITISLTDDDNTPEQINLFLSYIKSFNKFIQLRSLSLYYVRSYETLMKILDQCHHLCYLTHLNISDCYFRANQVNFQLFVNSIWSLPKLIHCNFAVETEEQKLFFTPTKISLSLQNISIGINELKLNQINQLFKSTPHLKYLYVSLDFSSYGDYKPFILSTLIHLKVSMFNIVESLLIKLFQSTPNLCRLSVDLLFNLIDGYRWEQIIRNHLSKLRVFRLKMQQTRIFDQNMEEHANKLFKSFQNSFWIDEHQWFIRCLIQNNTIVFYTLSKLFHYCEDELPRSLISTLPHDDYQNFYNNITNIYNKTFFDQSILSHIRLTNISYLCIKLPINDQFWFVVPTLNRLKSLAVSSHVDTYYSQLQDLLDRAPNLYYLCIHHDASLPIQMSLFKYTNTSVRQLNLTDYNRYFNEEECIKLSHSPLGMQCEVLSIMVTNRESIIYMIKNMMNLRSVQIQCEDEKNCENLVEIEKNDGSCDEKLENKDELIEWLKDRLSITYLIKRSADWTNCILIWI